MVGNFRTLFILKLFDRLKAVPQYASNHLNFPRRNANSVISRWKKKNLRYLYFLLYPTCMGIEITSGFDSQMINGLQFIPTWNKCQYRHDRKEYNFLLTRAYRLRQAFYRRIGRRCLGNRWSTTGHDLCILQSRRNFRSSCRSLGCTKGR